MLSKFNYSLSLLEVDSVLLFLSLYDYGSCVRNKVVGLSTYCDSTSLLVTLSGMLRLVLYVSLLNSHGSCVRSKVVGLSTYCYNASI